MQQISQCSLCTFWRDAEASKALGFLLEAQAGHAPRTTLGLCFAPTDPVVRCGDWPPCGWIVTHIESQEAADRRNSELMEVLKLIKQVLKSR